MSLSPTIQEELGLLLEGLCEERLTAAEHARLEELLLADPNARAYYLNYIDLHGALYWDMAVAAQAEDDPVAALVDATILRLAQPELDHSESESPRGMKQTVARKDDERRSRVWWNVAGMTVASCLILGLGVWIGNRTAKPHQLAQDPNQQNSPNANAVAAGDSRAESQVKSSNGTVEPGRERHKFGSDDVKLPEDTKLAQSPLVSGANSVAQDAASEAGVVGTSSNVDSNVDRSAEPNTPPDRQANKALASSTAASSSQIIGYINQELKSGWSLAQITPSSRADDAEWLRRLHLDLLGHIPSVTEVEKFLANRNVAKRANEVDRLLDSPVYARNFATIWTNLLVGRAPRGEVNRTALANFLRRNFGHNRPWHEIVFDLVSAEGRTDQNGAANFLVAHLNGGAIPATGITARLFLGTHLQCSQCHNDPFSESKQEQFWAFNSFFQQAVVVQVPKYDAKSGKMVVAGIELATKDIDEPVYYETRSGLMKVAYPAFGGTKVDTKQISSRRRELARLMTEGEKSGLAPAFVNRMWEHFHGRSFTPVVDDMGSHVAPSHPQLLDRLSEEFVRSGYDTKQLIRWICNSEAYQLTSKFGESNDKDNPETGDPPLFSHMYVKPMSPEQLYDSLVVATQGQLAGGPTLDQSDKSREAWLRQFVVSFETEENDETSILNGSITQSLLMMNGNLVRGATEVQPGTWLHKLLASKMNDTERIQSLFASALSRPATPKELTMVRQLLKNASHNKNISAEQTYQDIYWALLNSNEFILNH